MAAPDRGPAGPRRNWLQCQENSLDPTHVYYLHGHQLVRRGVRQTNPYRTITGYDFEEFERGIRKKRVFGGDGLDKYQEPGHPASFPPSCATTCEGRDGMNPFDGTMSIDMHFRVPIDDTHTQVFWVASSPRPTEAGTIPMRTSPTVEYIDSLRDEKGATSVKTSPARTAWPG